MVEVAPNVVDAAVVLPPPDVVESGVGFASACV